MSESIKCENCGTLVHEDRISIVGERLICDICNESTLKEKPSLTKARKVCVIDDEGFMKSYCEQFLKGFEITHMYRIPNDESSLSEFDVLIVDGNGIGNGKYKNGMDFLLAYRLNGRNRGAVYHSGLCSKYDIENLAPLGIAAVTKGSNPQRLVEAVEGFFK